MTHNESRQNYDEIADSYFDRRINDNFVLDVMLGGGKKYFIREDRNLVEEFQNAGYQYVDNVKALAAVDSKKPLIGLFGDVGLPWALDSNGYGRLKSMAQAAVRHLENEKRLLSGSLKPVRSTGQAIVMTSLLQWQKCTIWPLHWNGSKSMLTAQPKHAGGSYCRS